jgi:CheY-like chemotaxis protein
MAIAGCSPAHTGTIMAHLLVIDDDDAERAELVRALRAGRHTIVEAWSAVQGLGLTSMQSFDVIVLDMVLGDQTGSDVVRAVRALSRTRHTPIVAVTRRLPCPEVIDPQSFGATCLLRKPVPPEELLAAVARCLAPAGGANAG